MLTKLTEAIKLGWELKERTLSFLKKQVSIRNLSAKKKASVFIIFGCLFIASCSGTTVVPNIPQLTKAQVVSVISQSQLTNLEEQQAIAEFYSKIKIHLPPATTTPIAAPKSLDLSAPLEPHQIFGFAPYWTLSSYQGFPYADITTFAYFGLDVSTDGTINENPNNSGFNGYQSQDLVNLIDLAHQNSDRVVLTLTAFGTSNVAQLVSNPNNAKTLASQAIPLIEAKNFDGVNIDFEGQGSTYRNNLTQFVKTFVSEIKTVNPQWQVTIDTYGSSAEDPNGPFDIASLNSYVDGFFVMAYDMDNPQVPSPTAPLSNVSPSDLEALATYTQVVSPNKIILGIPYYGYDWPTSGPYLGSQALGPPTPVSYAQIVANNYPQYWDPLTSTPWTSYQVNNQWHQIFFDNPVSVELKVALAATYNIAGVGVWALGMDGNSPAMLQALLGQAPPVKLPPLGPAQQQNLNTSSLQSSTPLTTSGPGNTSAPMTTCQGCTTTLSSSTAYTTTTLTTSTTCPTASSSSTTATTSPSSSSTQTTSTDSSTTSPEQTTTTLNIPTSLVAPFC